MALDPRYVTTVSLEEFFINNADGTPNAFGTIQFWQDDNRIVPKNVFELTGAPPNYTYTALPNPITLSAVGTPVDTNGNNVAIYYFPYDAAGNIQLYFVEVFDQFGVLQETREGWPNTTAATSPVNQESGLNNQLINPQFAFINFLPNNPLTITNNAGAGTFNYSNIIPGWILNVTYSGNGSIVVQRNAIAGSAQLPGNPPYTLSITPGVNVNSVTLNQVFTNNPDIFSPANGGQNGWIAASILLGAGSSITMQYIPNGQPPQQLLQQTNATGSFQEYDTTTQLLPANNPSTGDTGSVTIALVLPIVGTTTFSNVQIVGLNSNVPDVPFNQETVVQQMNQLFNYYNPLLQFKPMPSYLIGWEFSKNPAQFLSSTVGTFATGANTSNYVWDQTIVFQTANNGFTTSRSTSGGMILTAAVNTQLAVIQYLEAPTANELLCETLCSMVEATSSQLGGVIATISLWSTTGALPSAGAGNSLVTGLDANGFPTVAGGWTQVQRNNLGNARFTINQSTVNQSSGSIFSYNQFNNWQTTANIAQNATYFAYVIGFSTLTAGQNITLQSISLQPGYIATIPAPQPPASVLMQCQRYYQKSFETNTIPGQNIGFGTGEQASPSGVGNSTGTNFGSIMFQTAMNSVPTITTYNPRAANAQVTDFEAGDCSATATRDISTKQFNLTYTSNAATIPGNTFNVHWTADSRLGA